MHRRIRKLRCFFEPLRRDIVCELVGEPETIIVDSTLLPVLHPRQASQSAGFEVATWVRWGSFLLYGVKLHILRATNRVPLSHELTAANVADQPDQGANPEADLLLGEDVARKQFGDLVYRSGELEQTLAESGILLVSERANQRGIRFVSQKTPS